MSRSYNVSEFMQAAAAQRAALQRELQTAETERRRHLAVRQEMEQAAGQAMGDLVATFLPDLSPQSIANAVAYSGYVPLGQVDWSGATRDEGMRLRKLIDAMEQNPLIRDREMLFHPRTGSVTRAYEEALANKKLFEPILKACEHPRMQQLLQSGYGTTEYKTPIWRLAYYRDWEAADEIVASLGGKQTFAEIAKEYERARETTSAMEAEIQKHLGALRESEAIVTALANSKKDLDSLVPRMLNDARARLAKHFWEVDPATLPDAFKNDPTLQLLGLKAYGLQKKLQYADALYEEKVGKVADEANAALQKLNKDIQKFQRPKNIGTQFESEQFERRFRDNSLRSAARWNDYRTNYGNVYQFSDYGRGSFASDFLWWDLMGNSRYGLFMPDVYAHHQQFPYVYGARDQVLADQEAAAAELRADERHRLADRVDAS